MFKIKKQEEEEHWNLSVTFGNVRIWGRVYVCPHRLYLFLNSENSQETVKKQHHSQLFLKIMLIYLPAWVLSCGIQLFTVSCGIFQSPKDTYFNSCGTWTLSRCDALPSLLCCTWDLSSRPGIKPTCPAWHGGFLTTSPPGKSPATCF